ncbi:MAG: FKBP-type peptidyl-prolyl cis-trans isomerase [Bacteroidales bacterium]|nr:FKBP-type peptidyl-prolyl cis-trans isomerase [Bacteroidales bacterium]
MRLICFSFLILLYCNIYAQDISFQTTKSGLKYSVIKKGKGKQLKKGDKVYVHYIGKLMNDSVFDSSINRDPFVFFLGEGEVIKGWDEAMLLLCEGDSAILIIPPELGYGNKKVGNIPANSTLKFFVKIVKREDPPIIIPFDTKGKDTFTTIEGLKYIIVSEQKNQPLPQIGDIIEVNYTGYFKDGKIFDSSIKRGKPIRFELGKGQVIKGWEIGVSKLHKGEKARLIIPYQLAYGENGRPPLIPPKSDLIFDIELLNIYKKMEPTPFDTKNKDTITLPSGLKYIIVEKSKSNEKPQQGNTVIVHYTGYFTDGRIFDSSIRRGFPFEFKLGSGMVIKGWEEGIKLMNKGDKLRFIIPPNLAYGEQGIFNVIPPNATLIFDVELIDIK